jgi:CDP-paratose 2-epimerase
MSRARFWRMCRSPAMQAPSNRVTIALSFRRMRVVITGGAGFIGSNLAVGLASRHPRWEVVAADNLYRRGSELILDRLREAGVRFLHADVRELDDLEQVGELDALIECSAEPSVLASAGTGRRFAVKTNLLGAHNCLELAARDRARVIFLSTSRVYPLEPLNSLSYEENETRFVLAADQPVAGASGEGIAEDFPLEGARTLYGATKLAAELLVAEYGDDPGLVTTVNRCGVVAGPWQLGRIDQGVFTYWLLAFYRRRELNYIGYRGTGKQVRDVLHVDDLVDLIDEQLEEPERWHGVTINVGGGTGCSLSLRETSEICRELTGNDIAIGSVPETRAGDVPIYVSDCRALFGRTGWRPRRDAREILVDTFDWIHRHEPLLRKAL